jgi:hypothetical protein
MQLISRSMEPTYLLTNINDNIDILSQQSNKI